MGAICLSWYFYFNIEWDLPAGLVGTLTRCQAWSRLIDNWLRDLEWKRNVHCAKKSHLLILSFASLWWNLFPGSQEYTIVYWAENFFLVFPPWLFYALCKFTLNLMVTNWQVRVGTLIDNWLMGSFHLERDPHQLLPTYSYVAVFSDFLRWLRISTFQERSRIFPEPAVQKSHYGENVSDCLSDSYKPQIGNVIMFLIVFPFISYKLAML